MFQVCVVAGFFPDSCVLRCLLPSCVLREIPYDGFFAMIVMGMMNHWSYLYISPWTISFLAYAVGFVWVLVIIGHKRLHVPTMNMQQQWSHLVLSVVYLAAFVSHYAMQVGSYW